MAREYEVKLTRTTVEEASFTVEAPNQVNAAAVAALRTNGEPGWSPKSTTIEVSKVLWKQGGE